MKKFLSIFLLPIIWTAIFFIAIGIAQGKRFTVNYNSPTEIAAGVYNVQTSPDLNWERTESFGRKLAWLFLGAMWVAVWFVATDRHLGKNTGDHETEQKAQQSRPKLGMLMVYAPLVLSAVFFFANYSSSYVSNYVQVDKPTFDSWLQEGKIEKKGEKTYVDATDEEVLKSLFQGKRWVR